MLVAGILICDDCILPCLADAGLWLCAYDAEQRRHLRSVLHFKPQTFQDIRNRRIRAEKDETPVQAQLNMDNDDSKVLDGFFLVNVQLLD